MQGCRKRPLRRESPNLSIRFYPIVHDMLVRPCTRPLEPSSTRPLEHSSTRPLEHSSTRPLEHSSTRPLVHSSINALVPCHVLLRPKPGRPRRRLKPQTIHRLPETGSQAWFRDERTSRRKCGVQAVDCRGKNERRAGRLTNRGSARGGRTLILPVRPRRCRRGRIHDDPEFLWCSSVTCGRPSARPPPARPRHCPPGPWPACRTGSIPSPRGR